MNDRGTFQPIHRGILLVLAALLLGAGAATAATLEVRGSDGLPIANYYWTLEADHTVGVVPGLPTADALSVSFHRSYMPVVATGEEGDPLPVLDPGARYFVSVLPKQPAEGCNPGPCYSIGGAPIAAGQEAVAVTVQKQPIPTAQISIFVFEDNAPINNAPDLPAETGLAGFSIIVEDAGGRYGASAGTQMMDAFGNMIGTTYSVDECGNFEGTTYAVAGDCSSVTSYADPVVLMMGTGVIKTGPDGTATVKYLAPGKYGIQVVPPAGLGWQQTSTIEGTKVIDAWVKANEPGFFMEFGPPGWHVFVGFVRPTNDTTVLTGGSIISGQVVNMHLSRPPDYAFYNGAPLGHTTCWVGLNLGAGGEGRGVYASRCNADGSFAIPNVPEGEYQLVVWDDNLDVIFAFHRVDVPAGGAPVVLGEVPVFQWFTRTEHHVFADLDEDGFRDPGEPGIPEQNINLRWRDGTVYQAFPTDLDGFAPFDEVFPFFAWLVAEVDFLRLNATGLTVTVDEGGPIDPTEERTFDGQLNPQPQFCTAEDVANGTDGCASVGSPRINPNTGDNLSRTEVGPVLTQGFQGFLGQTSVFEWGKAPYGPADEDVEPYGDFPGPGDLDNDLDGRFDHGNGGISGVVFYSTTRAENDPRYGAPEPWEPGVPGVTVRLWNSDGTVLLNETTTDSWDDSLPSGCQGEPFTFRGTTRDCYDGLRVFNQARPAVFDGGYAFTSRWLPSFGAADAVEVEGLPTARYLVEVVPPPGYAVVREQDKNVDFGDTYNPRPNLLPPVCVGPLHTLPAELALFPGVPIAELPDFDAATEGVQRPGCERKEILLGDGANAAADFFLFTPAPISGHIYGFILDDTANEFDPLAPTFGEKYAPPFLPVSIRDWTGREISRVYSDEYGVYNALVPSTYTANLPQPSGMSPNMLTVCLNDPVKPDPANPGGFIPDSFFNRQYSQFCYTFQYMPGATTYLDTPVVPVAAFAGPGQNPLDCELPDGSPMINRVTNTANQGPYVAVADGTQSLSIVSEGPAVEVPNPQYDGTGGIYPRTITRDYSFGSDQGVVRLVPATGPAVELDVTSWTADTIVATVPSGATTGRLEVERASGAKTIAGVTVTVGGPAPIQVGAGQSIQAAIDAAAPGSLIHVGPGLYSELVVMWKPVRLQGWGPGATAISAIKVPAEKLEAWRAKVRSLVEGGHVSLLPFQEAAFTGIEPETLFTEEGPAIAVLAIDRNTNRGGYGLVGGAPNARIDGFTITGGDHGGGIFVNGYAHWLEIGNNVIVNNNGFYTGGIRLGHPTLLAEQGNAVVYQSAYNDNVRIHHNQISENGGLGGWGGGVSLCTGSDSYRLTDNWICGNFTMGQGAGVAHFGLSPDGIIARNTILFNESFNQGQTVSGGGLFIGGGEPLVAGQLSAGSGSVRVLSNVFIGNAASAGDGGAIRLSRVSGTEATSGAGRNDPSRWYRVDIINNVLTGNVAALAGGAISLFDAPMVNIIHNTIASNDSTGTAGEAFAAGSPSASAAQPAGIASHVHSAELEGAFSSHSRVAPFRGFSKPQLVNNILWHNRSFHFEIDDLADPPTYELVPRLEEGDAPSYWDLGVLGIGGQLAPMYCVLTDATGYDPSNLAADPLLLAEYANGDRGATVVLPETTTALAAPPAFDEGGNFIRVRFGPLTLTNPVTLLPYRDFHLGLASPAIGAGGPTIGSFASLSMDIDGDPRPNPAGTAPDIGADERP